jgi:hypothetical protein
MPLRANPVAAVLRLLLGDTLTASPGGRRMGRRIVLFLLAVAAVGGLGWWAYMRFNIPNVQHVEPPPAPKLQGELPTAEEFENLAKTDPVLMLESCLERYQRDGIKGMRATMEKQERVKGTLNEREIIDLVCSGEVPDSKGETPELKVRMLWESGHRKVLGVKNLASLYAAGQHNSQMQTLTSIGAVMPIDPKSAMPRNASRYSITDAGLYRGMLRTFTAWRKRKDNGELNASFLGIESPPQTGGRACYHIQRRCPNPEVDPFALDESPDPKADPKRDGAVEVNVYIDIERWLHVGTVLKRADGSLLGEYWFRDVVLSKEPFQPDPFTMDAVKAAVKR